ncbi:hypothetical protein M153_3200032742 [Pseudoloma neurophilia]|uniref:Uncharacterized protein n=1 Tax=Pseudoloma neurophilia TaxID=146866 RepID=A0A0R0M4N7_9MICR|nr:hypothetical protein M153_3200032742 [Pseudoloma neurophilia]
MFVNSDDIEFIQEIRKDETNNNPISQEKLRNDQNNIESRRISDLKISHFDEITSYEPQFETQNNSSGIIEMKNITSYQSKIDQHEKSLSNISFEERVAKMTGSDATVLTNFFSQQLKEKSIEQSADLTSDNSLSFLELPFQLKQSASQPVDSSKKTVLHPCFLSYNFILPDISIFQGINLNFEYGEKDKISIVPVVKTIDSDDKKVQKRDFWCIDCETSLYKLEMIVKSFRENEQPDNILPNVPENIIFIYGLKKYLARLRKNEREAFLENLKSRQPGYQDDITDNKMKKRMKKDTNAQGLNQNEFNLQFSNDKEENLPRKILLKLWMLQTTHRINIVELESTNEILNIFKHMLLFERTELKQKIKKKNKDEGLKHIYNLIGGRGEFEQTDFLKKIAERNQQQKNR